jgi:ATP-dependent Clp protease adapter protein ClpS
MSMLSPTLHQSIQRARNIASGQHSAHATPEHLLLALIDDLDAAPVMRGCDVGTERLRRAVSAALLAGAEDAKPEQAAVHPDPRFRSIIRCAVSHIRSVEQDAITGAHVLVQMFADPAARFLREQGMTRYDAAFYVCHGMAAHSAAATSAADRITFEVPSRPDNVTHQTRCQVLLLNDIYTPMDLVIYLLTEVFSITTDDAANIVLSTHQEGAGLCGTWGRTEARSLAERVMARAREFQHPLRCVTVPYRGGRARDVTSRWLAWLDRQVWQAFDQRAR